MKRWNNNVAAIMDGRGASFKAPLNKVNARHKVSLVEVLRRSQVPPSQKSGGDKSGYIG